MHKQNARLFGIFFILSFVSYAIGIGFMEALQNSQLSPIQIIDEKMKLMMGAFFIVIFHTLFNFVLLVIMFNTLKLTSPNLSFIYLLSSAFSTLILAFGALFLLLPIPVGEAIIQSKDLDTTIFSSAINLFSRINSYLYQFGMILWGCGGLILCYLLQKERLVPVLFPIAGYFGYLIFIIGCILELSGMTFGIIFSVPGGLFEILLSIWLIINGYKIGNVYEYRQKLQI